jgi:hypothetical protein
MIEQGAALDGDSAALYPPSELGRYAKMVKMILLVESSIRNNRINQFGGK